MSATRFFEKLHEDASKLERLLRLVEKSPEDEELLNTLRAVEKRYQRARSELLAQAGSNHLDVVKYRVINQLDDYSVGTVVDSLSGFQKAFTAVHDAKINGPKDRARFSAQAIAQTKLSVGYTYPGSFGFVLSLENSRDLFDGSLDKSIDVFGDYLRIEDSDDAIECTEQIGLAATSTLFRWVEVNANSNNSVDYQWRRSDEVVRGELVEVERFHTLQSVFLQTAKLEDETEEHFGILVGVDLQRGSFHFVTGDDLDIRGNLSSPVTGEEFIVPKRYVARLKVETNVTPATGERKKEYTLLSLMPVSE
ncbi:hypothetical protein K4F84_11505 [Phaeobacter inhibens]|uniref:hypothetical protein n=1 Tax=Phaeobacter inhibens TaxID=221822 RepID=UPI000160D5A9|nr:hypothetical protein [Phaeobacter inhibens]AFO88199.1 hypothetical protein PGA2_c22100 [Phaeobacter inhibens 2.10]AXT42959.1 hypothetical protein D1821_11455 [Phaeobacter inhibens]UWR42201.1 hypothetical protein K4F85_04755 [Phaeobacter inhibens]UWR51836.1 hypothetical protein K4F84_11505 [Phaeobacter inhibens]UWS06883.1 hypothetical protein K4K98_11545 [Phaeobacter inhibens]